MIYSSKTFLCYDTKMKGSEKAGSQQQSNSVQLALAATEQWQLDNYQPLQSCTCTAQVQVYWTL